MRIFLSKKISGILIKDIFQMSFYMMGNVLKDGAIRVLVKGLAQEKLWWQERTAIINKQ